VKDWLYTARWYAKNIQASKTLEDAIVSAKELEAYCTEELGEEPELIIPEEIPEFLLGVVVGHTKKSGGARFNHPSYPNEYEYNTAVAKIMKEYANSKDEIGVQIFTRDVGGISGAYQAARMAGCDAIIELHFNAFNSKVAGSETLCTTARNDKDFAKYIQEIICEVFCRQGLSRGVKPIARNSRGGKNVYAAGDVPNCLPEPFFGDNANEARLGVDKMHDYAKGLVDATLEFLKI
jgi:N-acetylmuramoyl-L-alanine amidase